MAELLKHQYNERFCRDLAEKTSQQHDRFPANVFLASVMDETWEDLELKDRMHRIAKQLYIHLELPFSDAIEVLQRVVPELEKAPVNNGLLLMIFPDVVEQFGQDDWEESMTAMEFFTTSSSAEFAIRPFLKMDLERGMQQMLEWSTHENEHVRRLASEGCRPRLPWAMGVPSLKKDPSLIVPILSRLRCDESLYVRRSVANNLNDIAKEHPELVLELCEAWKGESEDTDWLVKHACRTLLKQGNPRALALFGFPLNVAMEVMSFATSPGEVQRGESVSFEFAWELAEETPLRVEYALDFVRKTRSSRKVFKWSERTFPAGQYTLKKSYTFKDLSTRKHYPGEHRITVLVNGIEKASGVVLLSD